MQAMAASYDEKVGNMGAIVRKVAHAVAALACVAASVGVSAATLHVPTREDDDGRFNPAKYRSDVNFACSKPIGGLLPM